MNALERLIGGATTPIEEMATRLLKTAALLVLVLASFAASAAFLTFALFTFVQAQAGTQIAAVAVGGLYLGAAAIFILLELRDKSRRGQGGSESPAAARAAASPPPSGFAFADNVDKAVAPILGTLREQGLERERLALAAGAEVVKQLPPLALVALAMTAGVIFGRMMEPPAKTGK